MRRFIAFAALIVLAACAQVTATRGNSFVDPGFHGPAFSSLVIDAGASDLNERVTIERNAAAFAQTNGVKAIASIDINPPTRDTGEKIRRRAIMNTGAQAVVEIRPRGKRIIRSYIPGSYYGPGGFYRHGYHHHHDIFAEPYYDPPMILEEPESSYDVSLYTLPRYQQVWAAELSTRGPTGMDFNQVAASFGQQVIKRLAQDGMIATSP